MLKLRTTQQFKDSITDARRIFGTEHELIDIVKRALRWFKSSDMSVDDIPKANGSGTGNPTTIRVETELNNNQLQMVVIMYVQSQIEKSKRRTYATFSGDNTVNFRVDGE